MFGIQGPKFVEAVGTQLICPYCRHKFRAPQGIIAHKHMHERAGDNILPKEKHTFSSIPMVCIKPPLPAVIHEPPAGIPSPIQAVETDNHSDGAGVRMVEPKEGSSSRVRKVMTRRFSVAEKLRIIAKFKETNNISSTCRWVKAEFNRPTFARKSLSVMLSNEDVYLKASGIRKERKVVRARTGLFHRMDKELARWVRETRDLGIPVET